MESTPIGNVIIAPREHAYERATRTQLVLWMVLGYLAWITFAVTFESVERHRFQVRPQSQLDAIATDAERAHASENNLRHLRGMNDSVPYVAFLVMAVVLGAAAGIQTARWSIPALLKRSGRSGIARHLAFEYGLIPAILAFSAVTVPALMVGKIWEAFPPVRF